MSLGSSNKAKHVLTCNFALYIFAYSTFLSLQHNYVAFSVYFEHGKSKNGIIKVSCLIPELKYLFSTFELKK